MSTILVLPEEITEDIFLRLDAAVDLIRAAAACKFHRSVVCNRRFLHRYRSLHPPPVLGFLEPMGNGGILHAQTPHQSAPAASSLVQAADFNFSFLPVGPSTFPWRICDARDGRVLLSRRSADSTATFLELVICDPLYRRYVKIPPIPEDLWSKRYSTEMDSEPFLLPAREEEEDESRFRVIYNWVSTYKIISFLFDSGISGAEKWSVATTFSFLPDRLIYHPMRLVRHRHYVGGSFYWVNRRVLNYMLLLDPIQMKFSITDLPSGTAMQLGAEVLGVVDAGVNRLGMAVLGPAHAAPARHLDLYSKTWQDNGGSAGEWQHDKHHLLPEGYTHHYICGAAKDYLLLAGYCSIETLQYSILDLKTFQVERFCKSRSEVYQALPYARFPPSLLSPPSI